jgi:hypothetical protein
MPAELANLAIAATVDREDGTHATDVEATAHDRRGDALVTYTGRVDLRTLAPGRYVLTVTAARPGRKPAVRSTAVEIR